MDKRSYLLEKAQLIGQDNHAQWHYDAKLQMNTIRDGATNAVTACSLASVITGSKTDCAPGDDDPDYDAEHCY